MADDIHIFTTSPLHLFDPKPCPIE